MQQLDGCVFPCNPLTESHIQSHHGQFGVTNPPTGMIFGRWWETEEPWWTLRTVTWAEEQIKDSEVVRWHRYLLHHHAIVKNSYINRNLFHRNVTVNPKQLTLTQIYRIRFCVKGLIWQSPMRQRFSVLLVNQLWKQNNIKISFWFIIFFYWF